MDREGRQWLEILCWLLVWRSHFDGTHLLWCLDLVANFPLGVQAFLAVLVIRSSQLSVAQNYNIIKTLDQTPCLLVKDGSSDSATGKQCTFKGLVDDVELGLCCLFECWVTVLVGMEDSAQTLVRVLNLLFRGLE